jgi:hypothetical protein
MPSQHKSFRRTRQEQDFALNAGSFSIPAPLKLNPLKTAGFQRAARGISTWLQRSSLGRMRRFLVAEPKR